LARSWCRRARQRHVHHERGQTGSASRGYARHSIRANSQPAVTRPWAFLLRITTRRSSLARSIVIQDRAEAAVLGEQRTAAVAEQVQVERLVGLLLAVALDGDGLGRLAGGESQSAFFL
jgi:hypothetical protein